ncbi:hypothetical protein PVAP13_3KG482502 [Panicum virgatum]|uniref:Uncharacterized protein n=1 Tax=Panicum virgatum TaxID=38727 RepID=A0A8T0VAF8_PANVG|nr:hypothetical protein PVAP13_3KG482502 [Panicum virgatum]KAG2630305.1 hypothetical protein PVAP13_3KG482502 [Panicum virgatum]
MELSQFPRLSLPLYFCRAAAHACPSLSLVILLHLILSLFHYLCRQQLRAARGAAAERGRRRRAAAAPEEPRCGAATVCGADGTEQPWRGASAQSSGGERGRRRRAVRGAVAAWSRGGTATQQRRLSAVARAAAAPRASPQSRAEQRRRRAASARSRVAARAAMLGAPAHDEASLRARYTRLGTQPRRTATRGRNAAAAAAQSSDRMPRPSIFS